MIRSENPEVGCLNEAFGPRSALKLHTASIGIAPCRADDERCRFR
jgi:hypothetical protein